MKAPVYVRSVDDPEGWEAPAPEPDETAWTYKRRVNQSRFRFIQQRDFPTGVGSRLKAAPPVESLACAHDPTTPEGVRAMWADIAKAMYVVAMDERQDITARVAAAAQIRQAAGVGKDRPAPTKARLGMESLLGGASSDKASEGDDDATEAPVKASARRRSPIGDSRSLSGSSTGGAGASEGDGAKGSDPEGRVSSEPSRS